MLKAPDLPKSFDLSKLHRHITTQTFHLFTTLKRRPLQSAKGHLHSSNYPARVRARKKHIPVPVCCSGRLCACSSTNTGTKTSALAYACACGACACALFVLVLLIKHTRGNTQARQQCCWRLTSKGDWQLTGPHFIDTADCRAHTGPPGRV